jgi:hypothetical protein
MPVGLSAVNVSRVAAGVLAALWAMAGLSNEYAALAATGPAVRVLIDVGVNVFLAVGASLALVNAGGWYRILIAALLAATIDRFASAVGSGAATPQIIGTIVAFIAIATMTFTGMPRRDRS